MTCAFSLNPQEIHNLPSNLSCHSNEISLISADVSSFIFSSHVLFPHQNVEMNPVLVSSNILASFKSEVTFVFSSNLLTACSKRLICILASNDLTSAIASA